MRYPTPLRLTVTAFFVAIDEPLNISHDVLVDDGEPMRIKTLRITAGPLQTDAGR